MSLRGESWSPSGDLPIAVRGAHYFPAAWLMVAKGVSLNSVDLAIKLESLFFSAHSRQQSDDAE